MRSVIGEGVESMSKMGFSCSESDTEATVHSPCFVALSRFRLIGVIHTWGLLLCFHANSVVGPLLIMNTLYHINSSSYLLAHEGVVYEDQRGQCLIKHDNPVPDSI